MEDLPLPKRNAGDERLRIAGLGPRNCMTWVSVAEGWVQVGDELLSYLYERGAEEVVAVVAAV